MKNLRLLSLCLVGTALTLAACTKEDGSGDTTSTTVNTTENNTSETGNDDFGSSEEGDGDASSSGAFITEDVIGAASCDPWAQDCPEGDKCVAYASAGGTWDDNKCVPIGGDGQEGDPCMYAGAAESTDNCGADTWCWDVNAEGMGTCTPFCKGSPDSPMCQPGTACSIANNGSINLCMVTCNPLLQDCPAEGTSCFWAGNDFVCANATQDIPTGESCGYINDCVGGNICLVPESTPNCNSGSGCCVEYCDLFEPFCSIGGTECTSFFEEGTAPPGFEDVGVCVIPG